jgi:hypothetical protein
MARYLFQASYTSEPWAAQVSNPQNRIEVIRPVIERLGGRLVTLAWACSWRLSSSTRSRGGKSP